MKRKILLISVIFFCLTLIGSGSLAYFTAETKTKNVITTGNVEITIVEKMENEDGEMVDYPKEGVHVGMPGTTVSKIVTVKNDGTEPCWIRVKVTEAATSAQNASLSNSIGDYLIMQYTVDPKKWTEKGGFYYYKEAVKPGESTTALFSEVHFNEWMGNEYEGCTMDLDISAEAVQSKNNGNTVQEAQGWPGRIKE